MPRKLERVAEEQLLQTLSSSIEEQSSTALYACGGAIGIDEGHQPITIRFDVGKPKGTARKVVFPTTSDTDVQELVKTCLPASFGRAGKDVFDESYRRAGKLDNLNFSTSFHPADFGIIDSIQQLLRPGIKGSELNPSTMVRAELYKLNVYSGPSGKFKAHVDTPRGADQFGSLVVCLPYAHQGGQLVVRHEKRETVFDWGNATKAISWAAFYPDCEHEVAEVTDGHRITLTYNLFDVQRPDMTRILSSLTPFDIQQTSLYSFVLDLLRSPGFLKQGCTLGFNCKHAYAHSLETAAEYLPRALKGIDLALYQTFAAVGLNVKLRPVLTPDDHDRFLRPRPAVPDAPRNQRYWRDYDTPSESSEDASSQAHDNGEFSTNQEQDVAEEDEEEDKDSDFKPESEADGSGDGTSDSTSESGTNHRRASATQDELEAERLGLIEETEAFEEQQRRDEENRLKTEERALYAEHEARKYQRRHWAAVGKQLQPMQLLDRTIGDYYDPKEDYGDAFPHTLVDNLRWVNGPSHKEHAYVGMTYGNETSLTYGYSSLAIIAQIPPYAEREFVDDKAGSEEDKEDDEGDSTDEMSR